MKNTYFAIYTVNKQKFYKNIEIYKMQNNKAITILITGTNRGLGKQLALIFLKKKPNVQLVLTTRKNPQEMKQIAHQWQQQYPGRSFAFKKLDISSIDSIHAFRDQIYKENKKFDVIVNNAAIGADSGSKFPQLQYTKDLMRANVTGTIQFTKQMLPYLSESGRIINVSSKLGALDYQDQSVIKQFNDPSLEQNQIYTAVQQYIALCQSGDLGRWFKSAYGTSKMFLNAWSRFVVRRILKQNQISIAMSPGHCETDMGGQGAAHSAQSGAQSIFRTIFLQNPSFQQFYHRGQPYDYFKCGPKVNSATLQKNLK